MTAFKKETLSTDMEFGKGLQMFFSTVKTEHRIIPQIETPLSNQSDPSQLSESRVKSHEIPSMYHVPIDSF